MHRALDIKHRIVRRVDVGRAPLATFDSIDLGDGDIQITLKRDSDQDIRSKDNTAANFVCPNKFIYQPSPKTEIIGGNNSKKSLSQAGGGKDERKDVEAPNLAKDTKDPSTETGAATSTGLQALPPPSPQKGAEGKKDGAPVNEATKISEDVAKDKKEDERCQPSPLKDSPACSTTGLSRQGTLGRVSIPIRKQDSVSSSSSSEACNDSTFTFSAIRPSIAHLDSADAGHSLSYSATDKDTVSSLIPEIIDPSQILSPSKRKAYEKRIERLKVTTSPIARPRSAAPISVVTLDEYANLSSPEASPASPSILQDKLKITLPSDEFAAKPRTPKDLSAKKYDSEETCFEFTEEILFRCTKSALVVEEDGHLPISPRRVLIPPTITPATSPKLSSSPRLTTCNEGRTEVISTSTTPKLIYFKENITAQTFFGKTVDQTENENWADFPDSRTSLEKVDSENSEIVEDLSSDLTRDATAVNQPLTLSSPAKESVVIKSTDNNEATSSRTLDTNTLSDCPRPSCDNNSELFTDEGHTETDSPQSSPNTETCYNIKENSEDVLVLEIIQHEPDNKNVDELNAYQQDLKQDSSLDERETSVPVPASTQQDENTWAFFESLPSTDERLSGIPVALTVAGNGNLFSQSSLPFFDHTGTTAENQRFPGATSLPDTSLFSIDNSRAESSQWCPSPADSSSSNSCNFPNKVTSSADQGLLVPLESSSTVQEHSTSLSPFDQQCDILDTGDVTLTPFSDLQVSSSIDLISFSSSQDGEDTVREQL